MAPSSNRLPRQSLNYHRSADLFGSTKNYIKEAGDFSAENPLGRNIWFGIREHGMGAICNGAYDGIFRVSGATFLVFADMRGSVHSQRSRNFR